MTDNLWKLRQRKGLSVQQLAARTGIPARVIDEYERGAPLRQADLARLAKALYVDPDAIKLRSDPLPAPAAPATPRPAEGGSATRPAPAERPAETPEAPGAQTVAKTPPAAAEGPSKGAHAPRGEKSRAPREPKQPPPPPGPARPGQIAQLLVIAGKLEIDRPALEGELGKPVEALTFPEARRWLGEFTKRMQENVKPPSPIDRHRAHLPEGVDNFEMEYLASAQADGSVLEFTLFNGDRTSGRVVGFSPYFITIQPVDAGDELTLQKLAIAYYTRRRP